MSEASWKVLLFILFVPTLFAIIYHLYHVYRVFTVRCIVFKKRVENQWGGKIIAIYVFWRKPKFTCEECEIKKPKKRIKT